MRFITVFGDCEVGSVGWSLNSRYYWQVNFRSAEPRMNEGHRIVDRLLSGRALIVLPQVGRYCQHTDGVRVLQRRAELVPLQWSAAIAIANWSRVPVVARRQEVRREPLEDAENCFVTN